MNEFCTFFITLAKFIMCRNCNLWDSRSKQGLPPVGTSTQIFNCNTRHLIAVKLVWKLFWLSCKRCKNSTPTHNQSLTSNTIYYSLNKSIIHVCAISALFCLLCFYEQNTLLIYHIERNLNTYHLFFGTLNLNVVMTRCSRRRRQLHQQVIKPQ